MQKLLAFACIAALASTAALLPQRALAADPVALNSCNLAYESSTNIASQISGLDVQFTNESSKTATIVNIRTQILGQTSVIRDVGTFSPGIEIHHRYKTGGQFALPAVLQSFMGNPSVTCAVDSVSFEDGSTWRGTANSTQTSSTNANNPYAITLQPTSLLLDGVGAGSSRLLLASGGGALGVNSDCGSIAKVDILATTRHDVALRVMPKATGACTITLRDNNGNFATVPVTINP